MATLTNNLFRLVISLLPRASARNPNITLFGSSRNPNLFYGSNHSLSYSHRFNHDDSNTHSEAANHGLVGWWLGVSEERKDSCGQLIHISAEQGRYLATSYSPWQLAKAKNGTPVFEIYVTTGLNGQQKEQAIYLKPKVASEDSSGSLQGMAIELRLFHLTEPLKTSQEQWAETLMKLAASNGKDSNKETFLKLVEKWGLNKGCKRDQANEVSVDSLQEKTVFCTVFKVGNMLEKVKGTRDKLLRVPITMERKGGCSFCLTLDEDEVQHTSGDHCHEVYSSVENAFLYVVDCMARGIPREGILEDPDKFLSLPTSQAQHQQPILSCFTTYNRIDVPASSDPLDGLYIGSNGSFATEVIQIRRVFGPWHEVGGINDISSIETCEFVEAVNLTGDCNLPAGQVAFRARIGEEFKLSPGIVLEEKFGAIARYKGEGRLSGFQNSEFVSVEVLILGKEEYCKEGFNIGVLYSAPEYYFLKLYMKVRLPSVQESH